MFISVPFLILVPAALLGLFVVSLSFFYYGFKARAQARAIYGEKDTYSQRFEQALKDIEQARVNTYRLLEEAAAIKAQAIEHWMLIKEKENGSNPD